MSHKESAAAARSDRSLGIRGRRLLSGGPESFSSFYSFSPLRSRARCEEGGGGSLALHRHDCFYSEGDLFKSHTSLDRSGVGVGGERGGRDRVAFKSLERLPKLLEAERLHCH